MLITIDGLLKRVHVDAPSVTFHVIAFGIVTLEKSTSC